MLELHEIEELCKNVNRNAIKALLRNAAIMKDPKASPEMRAQAEANVKAISYNKPIPKPKADPKPKKIKEPVTEKPAAQPAPAQTPIPISPKKVEFHQEFAQHHGVDPAAFKATWHAMSPEQQTITKQWHAEQLAAPKLKVAKSIDSLYNLFTTLKKRL